MVGRPHHRIVPAFITAFRITEGEDGPRHGSRMIANDAVVINNNGNQIVGIANGDFDFRPGQLLPGPLHRT